MPTAIRMIAPRPTESARGRQDVQPYQPGQPQAAAGVNHAPPRLQAARPLHQFLQGGIHIRGSMVSPSRGQTVAHAKHLRIAARWVSKLLTWGRHGRARGKERNPIMMTALRAYDERMLDVITARRKRWLDIFMRCITHAGDWPSMVGITLTLSFGFPSGLRRVGLKCLAVLTVSHLLVQLMKRTINRPRPKLRPTKLFVMEPPDRFSFPVGTRHRGAGGRHPALLRASPAGGLHRSRSRAGHRRVTRLPGRTLSGGRHHGLGDGDHDRADRGLESAGLAPPWKRGRTFQGACGVSFRRLRPAPTRTRSGSPGRI